MKVVPSFQGRGMRALAKGRVSASCQASCEAWCGHLEKNLIKETEK